MSQKRYVAEQNKRNFGPSGLRSELTYPKYGRKSQTESWFHETGSLIVSGKWCVVEQNEQKSGPTGFAFGLHFGRNELKHDLLCLLGEIWSNFEQCSI